MSSLANIALYGWTFVVVPVLFVVLPARLAVFSGVIFGWLFLPFSVVDIPGPLELSKYGACTLTVMLCAALFDTARLTRLRVHLLDVPMLLWLISPPISSLLNGLGVNDAMSGLFNQLTVWGIPYILGRLYVTDAAGLRQLALVVFFAGVTYAPFVLWEMRMSPVLHKQVYGFVTYAHGGHANVRFDGWRPVVFQQHGLMLGLLMGAVAVVGGWLWYSGAWRRFDPFRPFRSSGQGTWRTWSGIARRTGGAGVLTLAPTLPLVLGMILLAVMCRALNAFILMVMVGGVLLALRNPIWRTRLGIVCLLLIPVVYVGDRLAPSLVGISLDKPVMAAVSMVDPGRASSMQFRVDSEHMLVEHALQRPVFGWAGWGRNRVYDEYGNDISVTDGYWIIVLGVNGLFGLTVWYLAVTGPIWLMVLRYPVRVLGSPEAAPAVALSMVVLMFMIDCLPNAMLTVIYPLAVGGLSGLMIAQGARARRPRVVPAASGAPRAVPAGVGG